MAERVWLPEGLDWPCRNFSPREILTPCAGALRQPAGLCKLMAYISHWGKDAIVGLLPLWHFCHSRTFLSLMCWAGFILHAVAITWEWMGFAFLPIIICQHGWNSGHWVHRERFSGYIHWVDSWSCFFAWLQVTACPTHKDIQVLIRTETQAPRSWVCKTVPGQLRLRSGYKGLCLQWEGSRPSKVKWLRIWRDWFQGLNTYSSVDLTLNQER